MFPFPITPPRKPKVLTYQTSAADTTDAATYTFSSQAIGTAAADRRVIVAVHYFRSSLQVIDSVTIGGVTASLVQNAAHAGTMDARVSLYIALVPTGSTADIVVTFDLSGIGAAIGVWSCTGLSSNSHIDSAASNGADPATTTLTSVGGGFCVAAVSNANDSQTISWTSITERYDALVDLQNYSGASIATSTTSISPSGDFSGVGADGYCGAFATW